MGDDALDDPLISCNGDQTASVDGEQQPHRQAWQLIQCILVFVPRAFDAQQCFITTFVDSSAYPSNILTDWSLEDASPLITGLPGAAFYAGCLLSGFLLTPMADTRLGRKNLLLVSCLLMSLSSLLTSFSPNLVVYTALRFASGFGRAPISSSTIVLATELVGPRWRPYATLLGFVLFSLGFASLPAIAFLCRDSSWRGVYVWTSLPALLYCAVVYFFVHESPRWTRLEGTSTAYMYSALRSLVSRKWARRRLALVMVLSFGLGMAYYGMPLGLGSLSFNLYLSVAMEALIELPSALAAFCLIGALNRRTSILVTTAACGVCSIACGAASGSSWVQVALELLAFLVGSTGVDICMIYVAELFPTCVRSSAFAMTRQAAVLGAGAGAVLVAVGESWQSELITYGGFGVIILLCSVFVLWLPETRGTDPCDSMEEEDWKHNATQDIEPDEQ